MPNKRDTLLHVVNTRAIFVYRSREAPFANEFLLRHVFTRILKSTCIGQRYLSLRILHMLVYIARESCIRRLKNNARANSKAAP